MAVLITGWWRLGGLPTESRDPDGEVIRALDRGGECEGCRRARRGLLEALATLDGSTQPADAGELVLWRGPSVHVAAQDSATPFATLRREAGTLGIITHGALTEAGPALLDDDEDRLLARRAHLAIQRIERAPGVRRRPHRRRTHR